jgi:glycosyltransferase involved in cell wall biosynthesis
MLFTVITPTYNRVDLIERTIKSILNQTFIDYEYIIIDDGSTDNTEELVKRYMKYMSIRYIKKENTGSAHTRNVGVSYANGDYITFLDSDDEALPEWLETVAKEIQDDTGIVSVGAMRVVGDKKSIIELPYEINVYGKKEKVKFTCGSLFIKREIFLAVNGYDLSMPTGLQSELGYRILEYLQTTPLKIVSIPNVLVIIYVHEGPRLRTDWSNLSETCLVFVNKHLPYFEKWDRKQLSNNYAVIAYYNYRNNDRKNARYFIMKAIRYKPLNVSNYLRLVKYAFL